MRRSDPSGADSSAPQPIALVLAKGHRDFLIRTVEAFERQVNKELADDQVPPVRQRCENESDNFRRLRNGLKDNQIIPTPEVIGIVARTAEVIDEANGFHQVMLQHRAFCSLYAQLTEKGT